MKGEPDCADHENRAFSCLRGLRPPGDEKSPRCSPLSESGGASTNCGTGMAVCALTPIVAETTTCLRRVAVHRVPVGRPGSLVPVALPQRILEERETQDNVLGTVPRAGPARAPQSPTRRARDRRLARDQGVDRLLLAHGPHHLNSSSPTQPNGVRHRLLVAEPMSKMRSERPLNSING